MTTILEAMVIAQYENDLIEYGKIDVLDPDVHALSWDDLSDEEQNLRKKAMAAALRKAAEERRKQALPRIIDGDDIIGWLLGVAEQAP